MPSLFKRLIATLLLITMASCQSMTYGMRPQTPLSNGLSPNQAREFETGTVEEKDNAGLIIFAILGGAAAAAGAVIATLAINDKL